MSTGLERGALVAGVVVLAASLEFGAGVAGAGALLPATLLLSAGATLLWTQFGSPRRAWVPPVVFSVAALVVTVVLEVSLHTGFAAWFDFLFAAAGSGAAMWFSLRSRVRCNLCQRRLSASAVVFTCPRCTMRVCDETCWSFEHRRCELCLEQRVPILPITESWWSRVTGPRFRQGRCQVCLGTAEAVDLRACPHCRRTQCRDCWDFSNGDCARCGTTLPELPESLRKTVAEVQEHLH
jgi:hypothetical protein